MASKKIEFGNSFIGKAGNLDGSHLASRKLVALYFSAHWCPPCRGFTPVLAEWYNKVQAAHPGVLEVIFASFDQDAAQFEEYFHEMPWIAFPFKDERIEPLGEALDVSGIPALLVFDSKGTLISSDGRSELSSLKEGAVAHWLSKL